MLGFPYLSKKIGRKKLNSWNEIEFQEVLLDSLAQKRAQELGVESQRLELPISQAVLVLTRIVVFGLVAVLLGQSFYLQIIKGKDYSALALKNQLVERQTASLRGVIYDRNMKQLVFNLPAQRLMVDKRKLTGDRAEKVKMIEELADLLGREPSLILEQLESSTLMVEPVAFNITTPQLLEFYERQEDFPGFFVEDHYTRNYIEGPVFSHLMGYIGKVNEEELRVLPGYTGADYIGKTGLELSYEDILRGKPGVKEVIRNVRGDIVEERMVETPEPGNSLILWVDSELQKKASESLKRVLALLGLKKGAIVALDPRNGGVLAIVSEPSFDNNLFAEGIPEPDLAKIIEDPNHPLFNRAIAGQYLVGSTIKPLIAAAALKEGLVKEDTLIFAPLELCLKNIYSGEKECFQDWTFHGWTDLKRAIAESVNPYFYIIGGGYRKNEFSDPRLLDFFEGLGVIKIKEYLSLFGWGQRTGIDLPGEAAGRVPDPEWKKAYFKRSEDKVWYLGDTYNLSIGQGFILATPLQLASAFSAIANGGTLYKPRVVQKIVDSERNTVQEFSPEIIREGFIEPENLKIVRDGMRQAVTSGSATLLSSLPVAAAAKTGTAQVSANSDLYYNWLTVFAPYENPEIVLTIIIEDVRGIQAAALPVAKEVLEWYFSTARNP